MKIAVLIFLFLFLSVPVYAELTDADLDKIRLIVNDSENNLKEYTRSEITSSENRMKSHIKDQIEGVKNSISAFKWVIGFFMAFIAILITSIGRGKRVREQEQKTEDLAQEIKELRQQYAILTGSGL